MKVCTLFIWNYPLYCSRKQGSQSRSRQHAKHENWSKCGRRRIKEQRQCEWWVMCLTVHEKESAYSCHAFWLMLETRTWTDSWHRFIFPCKTTGGKGVEISLGNTANSEIGFNAGGFGVGNNININVRMSFSCHNDTVWTCSSTCFEFVLFEFVFIILFKGTQTFFLTLLLASSKQFLCTIHFLFLFLFLSVKSCPETFNHSATWHWKAPTTQNNQF